MYHSPINFTDYAVNERVYTVAASCKGRREFMEDIPFFHSFEGKCQNWIVSGVIDGHSSADAALYVDTNLTNYLQKKFDKMNCISAVGCITSEKVKSFIMELEGFFYDFDSNLNENEAVSNSGAVFSGVLYTDSYAFIINLGDSQSLIKSKDGPPVVSTVHRVTSPEERRRILDCKDPAGMFGYTVNITDSRVRVGTYGQSKSLEPTRGFGDVFFKSIPSIDRSRQPVISKPEVKFQERNKYKDLFSVSFSDGFPALMSAEFISEEINRRIVTDPLRTILEDLINAALNHPTTPSFDNLSIVVTVFPATFKLDWRKLVSVVSGTTLEAMDVDPYADAPKPKKMKPNPPKSRYSHFVRPNKYKSCSLPFDNWIELPAFYEFKGVAQHTF